jgi:hypothetical protein
MACGNIQLDVWIDSLSVEELRLQCPKCQCEVLHLPMCNGGIKTRFRMNDWPTDPDFYAGQIKAGDVTAHDSHGDEVRRYHSGSRTVGEPMHDNPQYRNGTDKRETRRDKVYHADWRKRGKLPLVFDQKGKENA